MKIEEEINKILNLYCAAHNVSFLQTYDLAHNIKKLCTKVRLSALEELKEALPEELAEESMIHTADIRNVSTTQFHLEVNKEVNQFRSLVLEKIKSLEEK